MSWSYKPLWILLIQKDMKRTDLLSVAGLTSNALAKMGKNEPTTMDNLARICQTLHCRVEDIVEFIPDSPENE
ncbi:MAG: helix-turn-helix domain-containing protein [Oscillibacter sp.]|jgi:DNA (cytosine-5)-methyltransferase 1|nr:helix-turn-helix domain-containing protein [Oscillibacter sp.]